MSDDLPSITDLMWPALVAVREAGGSVTLDEHDNAVAEDLSLSERQQTVQHGDGPKTEFRYRMAWARTYLKNVGALENSARGVWAVTRHGRTLGEQDVHEAFRKWRTEYREQRQADDVTDQEEDAGDDPEEFPDWTDALLDRLQQLSGEGFERLAQRLLREAGFLNVEVLGRSGDGGIDGVGHYRMSLVTFPIYFQCKRHSRSIPSKDVRDFRGAMQGRGEKGLFITTSVYTRGAQEEATRDGALPLTWSTVLACANS